MMFFVFFHLKNIFKKIDNFSFQKQISFGFGFFSLIIGLNNLFIYLLKLKLPDDYNFYIHVGLLMFVGLILIASNFIEKIGKIIQLFFLYLFACISTFFNPVNIFGVMMLILFYLLIDEWNLIEKNKKLKFIIFAIIFIIFSCNQILFGWRPWAYIIFFIVFGYFFYKIYNARLIKKIKKTDELNKKQSELLIEIKEKMMSDEELIDELVSIIENKKAVNNGNQ